MNTPYWYYNPNVKQANNWGEDIKGAINEYGIPGLNPYTDQLANYGLYGGLGALGGAGIGALVEALRGNEEKNYLKAILAGGGIGLGAGLGVKGLGDIVTGDKGKKYRENASRGITLTQPAPSTPQTSMRQIPNLTPEQREQAIQIMLNRQPNLTPEQREQAKAMLQHALDGAAGKIFIRN